MKWVKASERLPEVDAKYFVKYIQGMQKEGITIDAITPQNEPLHPGNNPSLLMISDQQRDFIKQSLGPIFKSNNIQKLYGQESFIEGPNKVLSSLRYNKNGNPDWGVKISETEKKYLVEFYEEEKITFTKKVNSLDQVQETINSLYKKFFHKLQQ